MRYAIFSHDANPKVDRPSFKISRARGDALLSAGEAYRISPRELQLAPPRILEDLYDFGTTSDKKHGDITAGESKANAEWRAKARNSRYVHLAHQKVVQWPLVNESCSGAKAIMVRPKVQLNEPILSVRRDSTGIFVERVREV